jgi:hypothetical protein
MDNLVKFYLFNDTLSPVLLPIPNGTQLTINRSIFNDRSYCLRLFPISEGRQLEQMGRRSYGAMAYGTNGISPTWFL